MTLRSAIPRFCVQMEADGKSPLTIRVYRGELERLLAHLGPSTPTDRVRPDQLARYFAGTGRLVAGGDTARSARTLNRSKAAVRLFFDYLVLRGTLRHSPARLLKNGRTDRPIPNVLTDDEVRRFEKALAVAAKDSAIGRRDQVLFTLLLRSGMRLTAALAIDVGDLNLDDCSLVSCGKHGRNQGVYLPRRVVRMLRRHIRERGDDTGGAVFRSSQGRRLSARQAQYRFRLVLDLAGIDRPVTVHSLRHRFATELHKRTGDLQIVQAALGHRQIGTTEVYSQAGHEDLRDALAR